MIVQEGVLQEGIYITNTLHELPYKAWGSGGWRGLERVLE